MFIMRIISIFWHPVKTIFRFIKNSRTWVTWDRGIVIILLLGWLSIILGGFIVIGSQNFEGNLTVKKVSFTYDGEPNRLFTQPIDNIQSLSIQGKQSLVISGKFSSSDSQLFKQDLTKLKQITLELPYPNSYFSLTPATLNKSELSLEEIRLQSKPRVSIDYHPKNSQITFCFPQPNSSSSDTSSCLDNYAKQTSQPTTGIASLKVDLGQKPLELLLSGVNISKLGIKSNMDDFKEVKLLLQPDNLSNELSLSVSSPTNLII